MTSEEYSSLKKNNHSFYTGQMGKVFSDWNEKKINGTEAVQMLKRWYDKGIQKVENKKNEKDADIEEQELKRCFDSLASYIRDIDLVDEEKAPDKQKDEPMQNELVPKMIEKGILSKDGKRPLKSLDSIACFLVEENQFPTVISLQDLGLTKRNGKPYSDRAYKKALNVANSYSQTKRHK